jgi:D-beta-D-heptose 7-phosphate kinase/D-beta-D-heptose 1-phosphate adenosyltransferase
MQNQGNNPPSVLVIGDLMLDRYLIGNCERISPEAPVQIIDVREEKCMPGGAGNVVKNLLSLGASASLISVIGDDPEGEVLLELLRRQGIDTTSIIREQTRKTIQKSRVIASHQNIVRFDQENREEISSAIQGRLLTLFNKVVDSADIILLSDYDKGVLPKAVCEEIIRTAARKKLRVLADPKTDFGKYKNSYLVKPNRLEAARETKIELKDEESIRKAGFKLLKLLGCSHLIITLGEKGMAIFNRDDVIRISSSVREVYDVTGAGDTVLAVLGYFLACGRGVEEAARLANSAAAIVIQKTGTATTKVQDSYECQAQSGCYTDYKIKTVQDMGALVSREKKLGKKIVFTNGCFDIMHAGHIKYLQKAKTLGDILVLGLNSDDSIRRIKGQGRPFIPEAERAYILSALDFIDYVIVFNEDTPLELIKLIQPDILVKGEDYKGKEVVGSNLAGETVLIPFIEDVSTTKIINKIRARS